MLVSWMVAHRRARGISDVRAALWIEERDADARPASFALVTLVEALVGLRASDNASSPSEESARAIADRRLGVGCDQIMIIEPPRTGGDAYIAIRNADGGVVEACGNGFRAGSGHAAKNML